MKNIVLENGPRGNGLVFWFLYYCCFIVIVTWQEKLVSMFVYIFELWNNNFLLELVELNEVISLLRADFFLSFVVSAGGLLDVLFICAVGSQLHGLVL